VEFGALERRASAPELVGFLAFRSGCEIFVHFAGFHDEDDAASGGGVIERVAVHGDDIGVHTWSDGADFVFEAQGLGGD
jgi:hypothetical protein